MLALSNQDSDDYANCDNLYLVPNILWIWSVGQKGLVYLWEVSYGVSYMNRSFPQRNRNFSGKL